MRVSIYGGGECRLREQKRMKPHRNINFTFILPDLALLTRNRVALLPHAEVPLRQRSQRTALSRPHSAATLALSRDHCETNSRTPSPTRYTRLRS